MDKEKIDCLVTVAEDCGSVTLSREDFLQLVRERGAAINDLKEHTECEVCKHLNIDDVSEFYTETCLHCGRYPWNDIKEEKDLWEWRGLQDGTD